MFYYKKNSGFTLIEMLVSISIALVILGVFVSSQSTYTDGAALSGLADEISSKISEAQAYGIGVRELSAGSEDFTISYGLTFSLLGTGSNKDYLSFADRNANKRYDGDWTCPIGGASECLGKTGIQNGNFITYICVITPSGPDNCHLVGRVDISFARPKTEAQITFYNQAGTLYVPSNALGASIFLESPRGSRRAVLVYNTGQISVQ